MKRHIQMTGVRRWAGNDLIELQQQPLQAIDAFFAQYGNCILKGCEVIPGASDNIYNITPGFVALAGTDQDNNETFKVVPFAGIEGVTLPVYLTLIHSVIERPYTDGKVKPVAYDFRAAASSILPENASYLEISVTGGRQFVDAIRLTEKLDQTGNGRDVTVTFAQAAQRENVSSGEKLSVLWGKVCRWFADLKAVAFSGKAADLTEDQTHRFFTDAERNKLNGIAENANRYVHPASHPANIVEQDATHRFVSDTEKTAWNSKAAGTHTHKASEINEETNKRFLTDAERTKINNTYAKTDTYNRGEIDTKDTAILDSAKKYVMDRISDVISGSPAALDTLYEIANALNNDPHFATTIMAIINGKADSGHKHTKNQITDFPTSLPASDVYPWAKAASKPEYTYSEVGAAAANHNHDSVYQPKGSYAAENHNHAGVYQPAGSYAAADHGHNASAITEETNKRFMTDAERSKLAGIETNANKYVHPNNTNTRHVTDAEKTKWNNSSPEVYKNQNGYIKIGGITIQWGSFSYALGSAGNSGGSGKTVYFPTSFPSGCFQVVLNNPGNISFGCGYIGRVKSFTRSSFVYTEDGFASGGAGSYAVVGWFAVGY